MSPKSNARAFSLVEVLIVCALLSLLFAITWQIVQRVSAATRMASLKNSLQQEQMVVFARLERDLRETSAAGVCLGAQGEVAMQMFANSVYSGPPAYRDGVVLYLPSGAGRLERRTYGSSSPTLSPALQAGRLARLTPALVSSLGAESAPAPLRLTIHLKSFRFVKATAACFQATLELEAPFSWGQGSVHCRLQKYFWARVKN